jgi:hypothetical protein
MHGSLDKESVFVAAHKTPAIDYVSVHMWLKNLGLAQGTSARPGF